MIIIFNFLANIKFWAIITNTNKILRFCLRKWKYRDEEDRLVMMNKSTDFSQFLYIWTFVISIFCFVIFCFKNIIKGDICQIFMFYLSYIEDLPIKTTFIMQIFIIKSYNTLSMNSATYNLITFLNLMMLWPRLPI